MIDHFALMIGAMKSGTTALFYALRQHPEIAACRQKEPNFFSHEDNKAKGLEWYRSLWDWEPERHRWALEASTNYTKMPARPNAALVARNMPAEFRFLYVVRDPVERIRSQYLHSLAKGWIGRPITKGVSPQALLFSNYAFQLYPYEVSFGRESICVVRYEDFLTDRSAVLHKICTFLEIDADFPFCDPGPRNSSDAYRKELCAKVVAGRSALSAQDLMQALAPLPFEAFVEQCAVLAGAAGSVLDADALVDELQASYTPSVEQAAEIRELLRTDLQPFCERWDLEPWEGIGASTLVS